MMKLIFSIFCLVLVSGSVFSQSEKHQVLDKALFKSDIQQWDIQLIDVRTPEEFEAGKIGDAININVLEPETFIEEINALDKEKPVYIYCRSGKRSAKAAALMLEAGFTKVYDLEGGYLNWTAEDTEEE